MFKSLGRYASRLMRLVRSRFEYFSVVIMRGLSIPLRYAINVVSARIFGPAVVGYFAVTRSFLDFLLPFAGLGGDKTILRLLAPAKAEKDERKLRIYYSFLFWMFLFLGFVFGAALYLFSGPVAQLYGNLQYKTYFQLTAFVFPILLFLILQHQTFRATGRSFLATLFETTLYNAITLLAIVVVSFLALRYIWLKQLGLHVAFLIGTAVAALLAFVLQIRLNKIVPLLNVVETIRSFFRYTPLKQFVHLVVSLSVINILVMFNAKYDKFLLPAYATPQQIGIYDMAGKLALLLVVPLMAVLTVTPKYVAQYFQEKKYEKLKNYLKKVSVFILALDFPLYVLILVLSKWLLSMFGPEFVSGYKLLWILATAEYINASTGPVGQALILVKNERAYIKNIIIGTLLSLTLTTFLIVKYGVIGAAIGYGINVIFMNLANYFSIFKYLNGLNRPGQPSKPKMREHSGNSR